MLFRVISQWYNTREDMLRLLNGCMSGPSTTVGSDLNLNRHLWIQGGVQVRQRIRNPNNYPVFVHIYKCSLKCDDVGSVDGVYTEGTLPFGTGSAMVAGNRPWDSYWDFFDQSMRQQMGIAADTAYMKFTPDNQLAINSTGGYTSSLFASANAWETGLGASSSMDFRENMSLTWIFPNMKRKLRIRTVFKGWIPGLAAREFTYSASTPSELRPRDYVTNDTPNFTKHSYFLLARSYAAPLASSVLFAADQDILAVAARDTAAMQRVPDPYLRPPASFVLSESRTFRVRRGGDSVPSFGSCAGSTAPPVGGAVGGGGWLGPDWGLQQFGSQDVTPNRYVFANSLGVGDNSMATVPTRNQRALIDPGATLAPGSCGGNVIMTYGGK